MIIDYEAPVKKKNKEYFWIIKTDSVPLQSS